ncbi:ABC transporter substrate-binding protein [Acidisoma sp. S159]|uniref:substrate-binding periplasmic protein n=1 Tax=Acidisoma sp. S159 TaxID=1747225 RepID=UPI00131C1DD0|nr:transporter substrate-binding domain-containing protein [Acidisoma sp. S159]
MTQWIKFVGTALLVTSLCGLTSAYAASCTPRHDFSVVEPGFITVAATTYAPFSYIGNSGQLGGIDGDILSKIADMECLKIKAVLADGGAGIQYVMAHKADTTTGDWYRTAARARVVHLSAPLYVDQMAVYSKTGLDTVDQLIGKTLGSTEGNLWNADLQRLMGDKFKLYPISVDMQQDLTAGRIEVGVDGDSIGVVAQAHGALKGIIIKVIKPDPRVAASLEAGQATYPMTKDNVAMAKAFDDDIAVLHANGAIAGILVANGLSASAAETGAPRLIQ